jgi:DNA-binding transcriptional MerR regulator
MTRSHLHIEHSEEFKALEGLLSAQNEPDGLMNLIRNPQFEFDLNLSSRMLNYHEANGFIRFHREGTAGKRRFSLVNALGFQFSLYLKRIGLSNDLIAQLNEILNQKGDKGYSDWDLVVYLGSVSIANLEIWVHKAANMIPGSGKGNEIEVGTTKNEDFFHLSKEIRETFFNGQGNIILTGKTASFLPKFVYEIDKVRDPLNWEKLSEDNYKLVKEFGEHTAEKFIDSNAVMTINELPASEYTKMYDIIHEDELGNRYGIEIKFLKLKSPKKLRCDRLTRNSEQLKQAIEEEIKFFQKMKEKLSRGS